MTNGKQVVLVLQGGGALGAYQAGAYQALEEAGYEFDWIAAVSIGAINGALIAGNPPGHRVAALRAFWEKVTAPTALLPDIPNAAWQYVLRESSAAAAVLFGQPGFFRPRSPAEFLLTGRPPVSFYDTESLRQTLVDLVDFDRIGRAGPRLSVGAVDVETAELRYFDSKTDPRFVPEMVTASGALPPGLSAVEVAGRTYWDGGLVSNTPLLYVLDNKPDTDLLAFQVDLFPSNGRLPENIDEVVEREKDIRFSSRSRTSLRIATQTHQMCACIAAALEALPEEQKTNPCFAELARHARRSALDILHVIYQPGVPQGGAKDFEFGRAVMVGRWEQGLADMRAALTGTDWTKVKPDDSGARVVEFPG
jgi:NTE family protein